MSNSRNSIPMMNGTSKRHSAPGLPRPQEKPQWSQHNDLIRYIYDSWDKVSKEAQNELQFDSENSNGRVFYYKNQNPNATPPKDFQPFDLEAWCGQREAVAPKQQL